MSAGDRDDNRVQGCVRAGASWHSTQLYAHIITSAALTLSLMHDTEYRSRFDLRQIWLSIIGEGHTGRKSYVLLRCVLW